MTRFMISSTIPQGTPVEALVVDDGSGKWLIVQKDDESSRKRTEGAKKMAETLAAKRPGHSFLEVLAGYFGSGSYSKTSDWIESSLDFPKTVERLQLELAHAQDRSKLARRAQLARVQRAAYDTGLDLVGVQGEIPDDRWEEFQRAAGANEKVVVVIPDEDRARIIAEFEAEDAGPGQSSDIEEVADEAEDVPRS